MRASLHRLALAATVSAVALLHPFPSSAGPGERPLVTARHGMVTSLDPLASMAGMKILLEGGNAFDAAVATALAVGVVDPRNSTLGGQGFATVYVAATREVRALNFFGPAPKKATVQALEGKDYTRGYLATPVPSNLRGYGALHEAYGKLPWAELVAPAIDLAENGFVVRSDFAEVITRYRELLERFPSSERVFLPGGRPPRPGEVFVQPALARTLRAIASEGPDVFYRGEMARRVARFFEEHDGLLSYEDLADYEARWVTPVSTSYRGLTFYTQPPNSSAMALLLQLNLLEGFDLRSFEHNSAPYLHLVGEVMRLALADRNRYVADPDFVPVPVERLLDKAYARRRRALIDLERVIPVVGPGDVGTGSAFGNTTHLTVADSEGNLVALTQTLGAWFGSGVVAGDTGVLFSNQMRHLHLEPDSPSRVEPGKRPRSNQSPTIVLKDDEPFLAIGTPGGDGIWQRLAQVIVNIVDFDMDIQTAVTEPRMIFGDYQETGSEIRAVFRIEDRIPEAVRSALEERGYVLEVVSEDGGRVNGILRDPETGFLLAGADPRQNVYAIGW